VGKLDGKVAFISGIARGQGRSHALALADEGADIIGFDACSDVSTIGYHLASEADMEETARLVRERGRRVITERVDVRDLAGVTALAERGFGSFGRIDIASANAGIAGYANATWELSEQEWTDMIDINLTGVFNTIKGVVPAMIGGGNGGSIVITSSGAINRAYRGTTHYTGTKYAVVGLAKALGLELAEHHIRVNAIAPTAVNTAMINADPTLPRRFRPDMEDPVFADMIPGLTDLNAMAIPYLEPAMVSAAVLWLASDESRHITGQVLAVDAGLAISR
jgi:(+)-trans-carveol dehydrogenase